MSNAISEGARRFLAQRAEYCCEYCHFPEYYSFWSFQVDHIISLKHGGDSSLENLAWSCFPCNNHKGSDISTLLLPEKDLIRLFNPRIDNWQAHFLIKDGVITSETNIGKATIKLLKMNIQDRITERLAIK